MARRPFSGAGKLPTREIPMKRSLALIPGLVVLLAGCGGGSGGGNVREESAPAVPVAAAQRFGGLAAPTFSAARVEAADRALLASGDTLVLSDNWYIRLEDGATTSEELTQCTGPTCFYGQQTISLADFTPSPAAGIIPVGQKHGIALAQFAEQGEIAPGQLFDAEGYGGWLNHSAFGFIGAAFEGGELDGIGNVYSFSFGVGSSSPPSIIGATWTGIATGVDIATHTENAGHVIQGQAQIEIVSGFHRDTLAVDVDLTNMVDLDAGTSRPDEWWRGLSLDGNGSFSSGSSSLRGRFYGPNNEEVGGTFDYFEYAGIGGHIVGAFGATRD